METITEANAWPVKIDSSGRIMIPGETRRNHGWGSGTKLILEQCPDGDLRLITLDHYLNRVQEYFRENLGADRSLVDELLVGRKKEAAHEAESRP